MFRATSSLLTRTTLDISSAKSVGTGGKPDSHTKIATNNANVVRPKPKPTATMKKNEGMITTPTMRLSPKDPICQTSARDARTGNIAKELCNVSSTSQLTATILIEIFSSVHCRP